jgi:hypothetical protein
MTTPQIRIIDGDTVTDRDMNAEELVVHKAVQDDIKAQADALAARTAAREALLDRLGITADEAQLLLGGM